MKDTQNLWMLRTVMLLSFAVGMGINVYPLNALAVSLRPLVLILVLIFWLLHTPKLAGIILSFCVGLVADLMSGTRLGQQAMAAVAMAVVLRLALIQFKTVEPMLGWMFACMALLVFQSVIWVGQWIIYGTAIWAVWPAVITSMLFWWVVCACLIPALKLYPAS